MEMKEVKTEVLAYLNSQGLLNTKGKDELITRLEEGR